MAALPATILAAPAERKPAMYKRSRAAIGTTSTEASTAACAKPFSTAMRNVTAGPVPLASAQGNRQHVLDVVPLLSAVNQTSAT